MGAQGPPQLGTDDIVRYTGPDHFLEDFRENLQLGRIFVRTKRTFPVQSTFHIAIEGPGVEWSVGAEVLVLLSRSGFVGLEFLQFEEQVKPTLALLVEEVAQNKVRPPEPPPVNRWAMMREEKTVIGAMPTGLGIAGFSTDSQPATRHRDETEDGESDPRTHHARASAGPDVPTVPPVRTPPDHLDDDEAESEEVAQNPLTLPAAPQPARSAPARYDSDEEEEEEEAEEEDERSKLAADALLDEDEESQAGELVPSGRQPIMPTPLMRAALARLGNDSGLIQMPATPKEDEPVIAPPAPSPAPLPPPSPAAAAAPSIPAEGIEAIDGQPGLRCTAGGVIRITDPTDLLGVYLTSIRHGALMLHGGPTGAIGRDINLKLASQRVVSVAAQITARVGNWTYVSIADATEVLGLLRDLAPDWRGAIDRIGGVSPAPVAQPSAPPTLNTTAPSEPPPSPPSVPPSLPVPPPPVAAAPSVVPEATKPMVFDEPGPPQPGRLENDAIVFRGPRDLEHELKSNLKNGGLIASSSPIPIRTHKSLRVMLGSLDINVRIEADVVYAAGGRVGFAVTSFGDVASALDRTMRQGFTTPSNPPQGASSVPPAAAASIPPMGASSFSPGAIGVGPSIAPGSIAPAGDGPTEIFGEITRLFTPVEMLELPSHRIQSETDLDDAHPLMVLDLVTRRRMRGIVNFKRDKESLAIYVHEGSVAFVDSRPWNEEHALGRIFINQKKLTDTQVREAVERAKKERRPLGKTLLSMGLVNANALVLALREQSRLKIEPVFSWSTGSFDFQPWQDPPVRADLVLTSGQGVQVKFVRNAFEHMTSPEIEELLSPSLSRVVQLTGESDPTSPLYAFQPKELRFLQAWIDGKRDLSNTVTGSPIGRLASLRLIGFGLSMNMLKFTDGKRAAGPRSLQPRKVTDGLGYTAMKRALDEDLRMLRSQNFFDVLGIHWSAHFRSFPEAYKKAKARFDVTKGELREAPPPIIALAKEALGILENAYKKLSNEDERIQYRKKLFDQTEREYSADMLIKQGEVLSLRGDRNGAIEAFETAVELAPNSRNRSMLAQARER